MEPTANHIQCETTGVNLRYRDRVKLDEPVWKKSMCNELGSLYQGWKTHANTDKVVFVLHRDKSNYIRATYVRAVYDIKPQKTGTRRTIITVDLNLIDHPGKIITPTLDLTTMKLHVKNAIFNIRFQYIWMDVKYFHSNYRMDGAEYIMIQI